RLDLLGLLALEDTEDRGHLGIADGSVRPDVAAARGCGERAKVGLGHLGPAFELAAALRRRTRAALGLVHPRPSVPGLLAELPHLGAELRVLPAEFDDLVGNRPAQIGVRG